MNSKSYEAAGDRVVALQLRVPLDEEGLPESSAWNMASPVTFCSDWRGNHADPRRDTEVRLLWSREQLYIRFRCCYREIYVYEGESGRRDQLWLRDVAEVFIRPAGEELRHYREFEVSPNGNWLDLDISGGDKSILFCALKSRVVVDPGACIWTAELALPMHCLTTRFDPKEIWRLNMFRIEGREPNRFYSAWRPTYTSRPNFHVPELFGELCFS